MKKKVFSVVGLTSIFIIVGLNSANADSTGQLSNLVILNSNQNVVKAQSIAADSSGSPAPTYPSPSEIAANVGAVARNAGGIGALWRTIDVIIITIRSCPQCFLA